MLDTNYSVETPEGVHIEMSLAGPFPRGIAWAIDFAIRLAFAVIITIILAIAGAFVSVEGIFAAQGIAFIIIFLLEWFYPVLFEVLRQGRTPGKQIMGLAVIAADGTPVSWRQSILRNFLRVADLIPFTYTIGFIAMLCNRRFQRLGDMVADTLVIYPKASFHLSQTFDEMKPEPPPVSLSLAEQRVLLHFRERFGELSQGRVEELANILQPIHGQRDQAAVKTLQGYVAWISGGKG